MIRSRWMGALLLVGTASAILSAGEANALPNPPYSASWLMVSGSASTGEDLILEIRDNNGTTVITTSAVIPVASLDTANEIRKSIESTWVDNDGNDSLYVVLHADPNKVDVYDDQNRDFRIFIRGVSGSFSEVTDGAPVVIDGVDYTRVGSVVIGIPTLTEWGLILLMLLLVASGVWMMRRPRGGLATS